MYVAKVFISHSKLDAPLPMMVAQVLGEAGHTVWWDQRLNPADKWDREIETRLREADAVVVLWTPHSTTSEWVRIEADFAREAGKLVPIVLERCDIPLAFRFLHAANLIDWDWEATNPEMEKVLRIIGELTDSAKASDQFQLGLPGRNIIEECNSTEWHVEKNTIVRVFDYRGSSGNLRLAIQFIVEKNTLLNELTGLPILPVKVPAIFFSQVFDVSKPLHMTLQFEDGRECSDGIPIRAHVRADRHMQMSVLAKLGADTLFQWLCKREDIVLLLENRDGPVAAFPIPFLPGLQERLSEVWERIR